MITNEIKSIASKIEAANGKCFLVGGCVRDYLLKIESKDIDIEVFGLSYQKLQELLAEFGKVDIVGQSFGVIKLTTSENDYDFSLPRRDSKNGVGHKEFNVEVDNSMTIEEAASRRDFTINSISMDMNGQIIDPYGGIFDLVESGKLMPVSDSFKDDPLRVLRGFQFAARFNMFPTIRLAKFALEMRDEYQHISKERVWEEWKKWALKGKYYRKSLDLLLRVFWAKLYPELYAIYVVEQDKEFHPEGNVDIHTGYVLEEMASICEENNITGDERLVLIFSALCHDFGKAECTEKVFVEKYNRECIRAIGHEKKSGPLARSFLESIGCPERIIEKVIPLVENHMVHEKLSDRAIRRLARRLFPATIEQLVHLIQADHFGRPPIPKKMSQNILYLNYRAMKLGCFNGMQEPLIRGQDIVDFGYEPGPIIGKIQRKLYEMQLNGSFDNKEEGLKRIKGFINNLS